ncbi:MAG: hypothetical protein WC697_03195 [Patescibacteria group bacterium]|jgi:hypothetical protein
MNIVADYKAICDFGNKHYQKMQSIKELFDKTITKESAGKLVQYFNDMDKEERPILISYILFKFKSVIPGETNAITIDACSGDEKLESAVKKLMESISQPLWDLSIEFTEFLNELEPERRVTFIYLVLNAVLVSITKENLETHK